MDMPQWFNDRSFGGKMQTIAPPPMMQQPSVNSQPMPAGTPSLQMMLQDELTARGAGTPQAPPQAPQAPQPPPPPETYAMPPMPPPRPTQSVVDQLARLQAPAGGMGAPGAPMQLVGAYNGPPSTAPPTTGDEAGGRMVGPGSWMPNGIKGLLDPNSLFGKMANFGNPSPAPTPGMAPAPMGLLPQLYKGFFG